MPLDCMDYLKPVCFQPLYLPMTISNGSDGQNEDKQIDIKRKIQNEFNSAVGEKI